MQLGAEAPSSSQMTTENQMLHQTSFQCVNLDVVFLVICSDTDGLAETQAENASFNCVADTSTTVTRE